MTAGSAGSWRAVFFQPCEDFIVPVAAVGGFCDPVTFIGEVDEFAGDTQSLQCGEDLLAFADGDSKVEVIMDDQHGSFEVGGEFVWRVFFVGGAVGAPRCTAMFVFVEPQFFGGCVHAFEVVDAAVIHEGTEFVGLSGEPVHHVAPEGGSGGEHAFVVDPRLLFHVSESGHEVDEASSAPVAADLIAVFLAEACAAAGVGQADDITLSGPDLGIPAEAPAVSPGPLRASVNEECEWPATIFIEAWRCEDPHLHGIAVCSDDIDGGCLWQLQLFQELSIGGRDIEPGDS